MDSTLGHAFRTCSRRTIGLVGAGLFMAGPVRAQDVADLSDLVFEPEPLSAAKDPARTPQAASGVDTEALLAEIAEHEATIATLRQRSSDWRLVEPLGLLAVAYQGLGRHEEALDALDEALSLTRGRRNNIDPVPLLEQKIPSYLALHDLAKVDETEERIYEIKAETYEPASREMYYATINLADWYTRAYYRENFGPGNSRLRRQRGVVPKVQRCIILPGSAANGCPQPGSESGNASLDSIFSGNIKEVSDVDIIDLRLRKINRLYAGFQDAVSESGTAQLDIIIDVARRIARLAFATKQEMDFERDNYDYDPNYEGSREQAARNAPQRMDESYNTGVKAIEFAISVPSSVASFRPEALAALLLDLGDWHLAYGRSAAAEDAYGEAYRVLIDAGFTSANVDRGLAADLPVQIPVLATHLYTRRSIGADPEAPLNYAGYVDVSYTVDRLGNASDIEFLGRSSEDADEIERLLGAQLKSMKFRPTLRGGKLVSPGTVEARYHYAY